MTPWYSREGGWIIPLVVGVLGVAACILCILSITGQVGVLPATGFGVIYLWNAYWWLWRALWQVRLRDGLLELRSPLRRTVSIEIDKVLRIDREPYGLPTIHADRRVVLFPSAPLGTIIRLVRQAKPDLPVVDIPGFVQ